MSGKVPGKRKTGALQTAARNAERAAEAHKAKKSKEKAHSDSDDELIMQPGEKSGGESETSDSSSGSTPASPAPRKPIPKTRREVADKSDKSRKLEDAEKKTESLDAALHKQDAVNDKKVRELSEKRKNYPSELEVNVLLFYFASLIS